MDANLQAFFRDIVTCVVSERAGQRVSAPYLGIDESSNNAHVGALARALVGNGTVSAAGDLWVQQRELPGGQRQTIMGALSRATRQQVEYGAPVKHWSWSDRRVAEFIAVEFTAHDRIVVLTENTRRDQDGLWRVLTVEMKALLEQYGANRLGLLLLGKRGKADYACYCRAVRARLTEAGVDIGVEATIIPPAV